MGINGRIWRFFTINVNWAGELMGILRVKSGAYPTRKGFFMKFKSVQLAGALLAMVALVPVTASADSGFYIGGSLGSATVEVDVSDSQIPGFSEFDEDDAGYKVFAGYNWDLPLLKLGIEGGYTDFGNPDINVSGFQFDVAPTGLSVFGVAGVGLGPVDVFGKAGMIAWDADINEDGLMYSDDGTDPAFGVGLRFSLGRVQLRGEYELFDIEEADVTMLSVGVAWQF